MSPRPRIWADAVAEAEATAKRQQAEPESRIDASADD
jgi:hypothetical protein